MDKGIKKKINVLIADSTVSISAFLKAMLLESATGNFEIKTADNLTQLLRCLEEDKVDILLVDLNLPESKGLESLSLINRKFQGIPVIVITGNYDEDLGRKAVASGAQDYLQKKKLDIYSLEKAIFYAIERKKTDNEILACKDDYEMLVQEIPDLIYELDNEGRFTFLNNAISCYGYGIDELIGRHFKEIIESRDYEKVSKEIVLPKYSGKITGDKNAPKLFDERRTGSRATKYLHVKILPKSKNKTNREYYLAEVHSSGKWDKPINSDSKKYLGTIGIIRDITSRIEAENNLRKQTEIIDGINTILKEAVESESVETLAKTSLSVIQKITESQLGFICEKKDNNLFDSIAISDSGWDACKIPKSNALLLLQDLEIRGLRSRVLKSKEPYYTNSPDSQKDWIEPPKGHPKIKNFLGIPLILHNKLEGIIGLANSKDGYTHQKAKDAEKLSATIIEAILHKRMELSLQSSENNNKSLIKNIPGMVYRADSNWRTEIVITSELVCGYTTDEFHSGKVNWLDIIHPDDKEKVYKEGSILVKQKTTINSEYRIISKGGKVKWISDHKTSFFSDEGEFLGVDGIVFDITERKGEEELRVELEKKLINARQFESLGTLTAGIAHEINTPIQYINDNTLFFSEGIVDLFKLINRLQEYIKNCEHRTEKSKEIWKEMVAAEKEADLEYLRNEIPSAIAQSLKGIEHVKNIVRAMKMFSYKNDDEMVSADLNRIIEDAILVSKNEWKYVAEMDTDLDDSIPEITCYAGQLNQVFINLIINSSHAIADVMRESNQKGKINISTIRSNNKINVSISDTGKGVPEKIRNKIFDPFFTTKGLGQGTGQGLALAKDIIENKHSGKIIIDSITGRGTTFTILLPINN